MQNASKQELLRIQSIIDEYIFSFKRNLDGMNGSRKSCLDPIDSNTNLGKRSALQEHVVGVVRNQSLTF